VLLLLALVGCVWLWPARLAAQTCGKENLLLDAKIGAVGQQGSLALLSDDVAFREGTRWDAPGTVQFRTAARAVKWDLGSEQTLGSVILQGDHNESFAIMGSTDGEHFALLARIDADLKASGLSLRRAENIDARVRFLQIQPEGGDGLTSISEVQAYCTPRVPPSRGPRIVADTQRNPVAFAYQRALSTKAAICLLLIPVVLLMLRRPARRRDWALFAVFTVLCGFAWTNFGLLHAGKRVHPTDAFHYFMGPKYLDELGHFELYNCLAQIERERGRGAAVDRLKVRDLRTNAVRDGADSRRQGLACKARFSEARWKEFVADVDHFRPHFTRDVPLVRMWMDHGYNGTPFTSMWLGLFSRSMSADHDNILWLTWMDVVSNLGAVGAMAWGLGPVGGVLTAAVIGCGEPWDFQWVGGGIGRSSWVFMLCLGIAFAARGRLRPSGVALGLSTLFRLFPAVFAGALGLWSLLRMARARAFGGPGRDFAIAVVATVLLGAAVAVAYVGTEPAGEWLQVMQRHADKPASNHMGLSSVIDFHPGLTSEAMYDARLTNPLELWYHHKAEIRQQRMPLRVAGIVLALGVLLWGLWRGAGPAEAVSLAGPLLFSLTAMTNYDAIWVVALIPLAVTSARRSAYLLGTLAAFALLAQTVDAIELRSQINSLLMVFMLVAIVGNYLRRQAPARAASGA
jgi:hypothetical protein